MLALLGHVVERLLCDPKRFHAGWHTTVHCGMKQGLADLELSQSVVDGTANVHAELRPALDGREDAEVYENTSARLASLLS